ncbi:putative internal virion protein [Erwinia phage Loshitsa2]|uniref:Internal virion protein n=1 Tax=Erwinia phage Loshitsa2 TaxID=2923254 RepID=A0AAE9FME8_9CAUD|nr:putative internal virion protein [Erwinia phage Loshitsa2]
MPVLRQDVNTGSGELQIGGTNYMVGTASPQMKEVQPQTDTRGQAIQGFLSNFLDTFTPQLQKGQQRAAVQGQIDATQDPKALENSDSAVDKQNIFMRDAYQQGYLGAAVQQSVTDFQSGVTTRAQQAGLQGLSDEEFLQQERQQNAQLMNSLGQYLPHMSTQTVAAVANSLDSTRQSALGLLQKTRLGQAKINNTRTIDQGARAALDGLQTSMQAGNNFDQSYHYIENQANMIAVNPILSEKEKRDNVTNMFLSAAQNMNDPNDIEALANKYQGLLGAESVDGVKQLRTFYTQAGERQAGATWMDLQNRFDAIGNLPAYQQADARKNFEQQMIQAQTEGRLSTGQMETWYNKLHKEQTPKLQMTGMVKAVATGGGSLNVESLHGAAPGVTRSEINSAILEAFPDTMEGNASMLAAGSAGKDPWVIKQALGRVGNQMAGQLSTLSSLMKPVTGDDGNTTYQIPQEVQANVVGFTAMYTSADAVTQQTLLNTLPEDWRGVVQQAIAQDPSNVNNNVLDTLKRVAVENASGMYKDVSNVPNEKMMNTDSALRWYQSINPLTTDSEESQRQQMAQTLRAEYTRIASTDRGLLSGKSPESINKMLTGLIQARTAKVDVGPFAANITLPTGQSVSSYAAAAGADESTYTKALQSTIKSVYDSQNINPDLLDSVQFTPASGGSLSKDITMTVYTKNNAGIIEPHRAVIPMSVVGQTARSAYQRQKDEARADGEMKAGASISTFQDGARGGIVTASVSGTNRTNLQPTVFNDLQSRVMMYEGFKDKKSGGSVGYGWHDQSGDNVPDSMTQPQAQAKLKDLLETRYVPMAQSYMKAAGVSGDAATVLLADLTYQRPADAKALAESMGKYQKGDISKHELDGVLSKLPSYTDAGGTFKSRRNADRRDSLERWANFEGNPQRIRMEQGKPF